MDPRMEPTDPRSGDNSTSWESLRDDAAVDAFEAFEALDPRWLHLLDAVEPLDPLSFPVCLKEDTDDSLLISPVDTPLSRRVRVFIRPSLLPSLPARALLLGSGALGDAALGAPILLVAAVAGCAARAVEVADAGLASRRVDLVPPPLRPAPGRGEDESEGAGAGAS